MYHLGEAVGTEGFDGADVDDRVTRSVIRTLLIANRGEIARRIIRTAREMGIKTVAVYSDPDDCAAHVAEADTAFRIPGSSAEETYLRQQALIEIAERAEVDSLHPGYGFLSENAAFARACSAAGLVFVGPSPDVIEAMGSKLRAKEIMRQAGVPVLTSLEVSPLMDAEQLNTTAASVGYPLIVKASAGGGGRGMRVVADPRELPAAVSQAASEARNAFGDATIFLEQYVDHPRHIEIQIFGDHHGNVVSLFERECSIQRRYQKIIEESPSVAVDDALRRELCAAAVSAANALGYVGAGTVEFVLAPDGRFFFLEVNTRLQVEHPVTEMVTGLDLVRLQLLVAQGQPLPAEALAATSRGHAVEARIYAEDPEADFAPATGRLLKFDLDTAGVRVDSGYRSGDVISPHYDAMLAKVISWAPTRAEATMKLSRALERSRIHGLKTNIDYLSRILRDDAFQSGRTDTGYLANRAQFLRQQGADRRRRRQVVHALAAAVADYTGRRSGVAVLESLPPGWRLIPATSTLHLEDAGDDIIVGFRYDRAGVELTIDGESLGAMRILDTSADVVIFELDGARHSCEVLRTESGAFVHSALGTSDFVVMPTFPEPGGFVEKGTLVAPTPGVVVEVSVEVGEQVTSGQPLVVLEAMKMQHAMHAPTAGRVRALQVRVGDQVEAGSALVLIDDEEAEPARDGD
jgi:propionyl-CoA carboxylase alpha chain